VPLLVDWSSGHHSYYLYYPGRRQLPVPLKVFTAYLRQQRARSGLDVKVLPEGEGTAGSAAFVKER
jgi:hypothetical protein